MDFNWPSVASPTLTSKNEIEISRVHGYIDIHNIYTYIFMPRKMRGTMPHIG